MSRFIACIGLGSLDVEQHIGTPLPAQNNATENTPIYLPYMPGYGFDISFRVASDQDKMLKKVFKPKKNEGGEFMTLHNVRLRDIWRSCSSVVVSKSRNKCWTEHLGNMAGRKQRTEFWWRNILKNVNFGHRRRLNDKETKFSNGFCAWNTNVTG
jgi:hypothetical protein